MADGSEPEGAAPASGKRRWRRWMTALIALVALYLGVMLAALFLSERLLFQPHAPGYREGPGLSFVPVDGGRVAVMHRRTPGARYTALYSHGNAEDLGDIGGALDDLQAAGLSVVAYDYPGYGLSSGRPSEAGAERAIEAVYRWMIGELGLDPKTIILYGRSLGGGPSTYLASREPHAALVLESAFTSAFRVMVPRRIFPLDRFPNLARVKGLRRPSLVIHGRQDRVIAFWHGEALFEAASQPKSHLWIDDAGHNDLRLRARAAVVGALEDFIAGLPER